MNPFNYKLDNNGPMSQERENRNVFGRGGMVFLSDLTTIGGTNLAIPWFVCLPIYLFLNIIAIAIIYPWYLIAIITDKPSGVARGGGCDQLSLFDRFLMTEHDIIIIRYL